MRLLGQSVACETIGVSLRFNTTCCCVLLVDHQHLLHQPQGSYSDGVMGEIRSLQIGMIVIIYSLRLGQE